MMTNYETKQERIWSRIYEMAHSGDYPGWIEIEWQLRFKDKIAEAREMFEDPFIRAEIDRLCDEARKAS
jgi:hypothetical protein